MQGQRTDTEPSGRRGSEPPDAPEANARANEAALLTLLLSSGHAGPWTREEIEREMSTSSALDVGDAIAELRAAGLANTHAQLVWASRAACRMDELEL